MSSCARWLRYGTSMGLSLVVLLSMAIVPAESRARGDDSAEDRAKQITQIEKKLAELRQKLVELKKADPAKERKPLAIKDALTWETLAQPTLSQDGEWFAYSIIRPAGKNETVLRQTKGEKETHFPGIGRIAFSHDNRWVAFTSSTGKGAMAAFGGRRRGPAPSTPPPPSSPGVKVVLVNLSNGVKLELEGMSRFAFAGENSNWLAVHKSSSGGRGDLLLHDLTTGTELSLGNVADFAFNKTGELLALVIDVDGQLGNGVQLREMKSGMLRQLETSRATYQNLAWTEKGDAFSVVKRVEDKSTREDSLSFIAFSDLTSASPVTLAYDPLKDTAFPKGMSLGTFPAPTLSEDRSALVFGIRERRKGAQTSTTTASADKPDLSIWHGNDERLPAQQEKEAGKDRSYSYLCAYRFAEKKFMRLADDALRTVRVAPKQRWAVATDDRAVRRSRSLDGRNWHDVYVIDLLSGEKHLALKQNRDHFGGFRGNTADFSPDGNRFLYYEQGEFYVYDMAARKSKCISKDCPTSFIDKEDDHNVDRPPTRPIGWAKDGTAVLISDNWDVWKLPIDGQDKPVNLTGDGKKSGVRYRERIWLDPQEKGIDLSAPLYFSAMDEWTKKSGFVRIDPKQPGSPNKLCWEDAELDALTKAPKAEVFVFTRETISQYPDYYAADATFKQARRLSKANPQQDKYLWSSGSMLVDYKSAKGERLQGALFLPASYEKGKKYPTVVYIYERLSSNKNHYLRPRVMGFDPAIYTSNGYAVLMPDIKYQVNDPGMSAVWCVLPALEAAVATGLVDKDRVGLQGHSWGGYQTAFLITQTRAFKAAAAGAPLTDLVSMYSSVYWNTGSANQPIFESSQGRFTGGYWDQLEAYLRNSPVMHAKNVHTPLLLLHNDKDGAVDFNQGVEYFNTLRRLDKPVVMLQYKGENHGLVKPANQRDYSRRMREFFDHHLMGKAAPAWLKDGVPHLKMEEHLKERASSDG